MALSASRIARSGLALAALAAVWLAATAAGEQASRLPGGSAGAGAGLFDGAVRLTNGGPPCAACHAIAGIPFPNGGTLGPDLTGTYAKFGTNGLGPVLATLPFPTMAPIFHDRLLTPAEQSDLVDLFEEAAKAPAPASRTAVFVFASGAGCAALLVLAAIVWRGRLGGVRRSLLREMRKTRGRPA